MLVLAWPAAEPAPPLCWPRLQTRLCKGRTKYNPTANLRLYVMPKEEVAMECPAGSDFYQV